jgi:apolipoprotein D and lipocalin family protein
MANYIKLNLLFILLLGIIMGCSNNYPFLKVVDYVDIDRYLGLWYEIASYPNSFQKNCFCTTAEYTKSDKDYIRVHNVCRKESVDGEINDIYGKAFIVPNSNNAKLKVQFFWPFKGDYWIIDLAEDYSYAVVGTPSRKYLWVLYRHSQMPDTLYQAIISKLS